jgi:hypothetical protein
MNELLARSIWIYQKLLFLYPAELRREFGDEMTLAFADDLESAWGDARVAGVIQIWRYALGELLTVALPGQTANPYVLSPFFAFLATSFTQSMAVWIGAHQVQIPHIYHAQIVEAMWLPVLVVSFVNALVAFFVTCYCARFSMNVLRLD